MDIGDAGATCLIVFAAMALFSAILATIDIIIKEVRGRLDTKDEED